MALSAQHVNCDVELSFLPMSVWSELYVCRACPWHVHNTSAQGSAGVNEKLKESCHMEN